MKQLIPVFVCAALATGCGSGSGGSFPLPGPQQNATGTVRLRLGNDAEPRALDAVTSVRVQFFAPDSETEVFPAQTFQRNSQNAVEDFVIPNVPSGTYKVRLSGSDADGEAAGVSEQDVTVTGQESLVTIGSLFSPGQVREIGRVSLTTNGGQATAASFTPTISATSRYVAFGSRARLTTSDTNDLTDIFVRDRTAGSTFKLSFGPNNRAFTGDSVQPDMSDDGRFVVFAVRNNNVREIWFYDPGGEPVTLPSGFVAQTPANNKEVSAFSLSLFDTVAEDRPRISGDSNFIVYTARTGTRNEVFRFDRVNRTASIVSRRPTGPTTRDDLSGSDPRISTNGNLVFFRNGDQIHVRDINAGTTREVLNSAYDVDGYDASADGRFVAVTDGEDLRLIDLTAQTTLTLPVSTTKAAMSLSRDGRYLAFTSTMKLVGNDANGVEDLYVYDRLRATYTRVNVSGDSFTSFGGASEPDIAASSGRVAFSSEDSRLVPGDTNGVADIFTADVPKAGKLYMAAPNAFYVVDNPATLDGPAASSIRISNAAMGGITHLVHDPVADRIYLLQRRALTPGSATQTTQILVYNGISSKLFLNDNDVAPSRVINLTSEAGGTPTDFQIDFERNNAYFANGFNVLRVPNISTASGTVTPIEISNGFDTFPGILAQSILVDTRLNELYVSNRQDDPSPGSPSPTLTVLPSASTRTTASTNRVRTVGVGVGINVLNHLAFDISPRAGSANLNFANLMAFNSDTRTDTGPTIEGLITFLGNGSDPLNALRAPGARRLFPPAGSGGFSVDRTTGEIYVVSSNSNTEVFISVYAGDANETGPIRTFSFPVSNGILRNSIVLDRTR